ncbi:hypothetical protein AMATHDRAFT_10735 [Amanita thiersii Skay4041]|uniref:Uncharacterized protein n=1 Tax=Amanita thiersii Skay4041 TaxID=703135 RepID=A0A2A9N6M9_9AGAR|nr:hypothetical protein AMATHDRAFT_10735 [Amanita thiersii Skay4041]
MLTTDETTVQEAAEKDRPTFHSPLLKLIDTLLAVIISFSEPGSGTGITPALPLGLAVGQLNASEHITNLTPSKESVHSQDEEIGNGLVVVGGVVVGGGLGEVVGGLVVVLRVVVGGGGPPLPIGP